MKYIKYLALFFLSFVLITDVYADNVIQLDDYKTTPYANFYNCKGNKNCNNVVGSYSVGVYSYNVYQSASKINLVSNSYGAALAFYSSEGFVKGNYYTVSIALGNVSKVSFTTTTSHTDYAVGTGNSYDNALSNGTKTTNRTTTNNVDIYKLFGSDNKNLTSTIGTNGAVLSYTFIAPAGGNYIFVDFTTSTTITDYLVFYGYEITSHGASAPSADDIKNALNSSFKDINSSINDMKDDVNSSINDMKDDVNSSINSMKDDVNSNINGMKDKQDQTNNKLDNLNSSMTSDDNDVNSSKCGMLCKLKNIASGITNLPKLIWDNLKSGFDSIVNVIVNLPTNLWNALKGGFDSIVNVIVNLPTNLWNALKGGFDAIVNGISSLFDGILKIFTPPSDCESPPLVWDFKDYAKANLSDLVTFNGDEIVLNSTISYREVFTQPKNDKDYTISFDYKMPSNSSSGKYRAHILEVLASYDNVNTKQVFNSNQEFSDDYIHYEITVHNLRGLQITFSTSFPERFTFTIKNFKIVEGTSSADVCGESQSFLGWLGSFFSNIIKGIIELPKTLIELLIDALKSLFVPTDDQLNEIIEDSQGLAENFGFVGESINFFVSMFTSLLNLSTNNGCISLPEFTIGETSLFDSITFWKEQNVCLADNPVLSKNIDLIRTITSIAIVGLFINFASREFFHVLNKTESEATS